MRMCCRGAMGSKPSRCSPVFPLFGYQVGPFPGPNGALRWRRLLDRRHTPIAIGQAGVLLIELRKANPYAAL